MKFKLLAASSVFFIGVWVMSITPALGQQIKPSQIVGPISPLTPNAASLGLYGDVPVSMYTGIPDITIPIYEINVGKEKIPVNLSYHAGGVKIEDYSSWVGTGWSLNAGGVINRQLRGDPDENMIDHYAANHADFNTILSPTATYQQKLNAAQSHIVGALVTSTESDIFTYNFGGNSGKFFMDPLSNIYCMPLNKIRIEPDGRKIQGQGYQFFFKRWVITANNGVKYYFGNNASNTQDAYEVTATGSTECPTDANTDMINTWNLTQIVLPGGETIQFNYENYSYCLPMVTFPAQYILPTLGSIYSTSYLKYKVAMRLTSITFPNGKVEFVAGGNRKDLPGDKTLSRVNIYETKADNSYSLLKYYNLYTNNPNNITPTANPDNDFRLSLDSVAMFSGDQQRISSYKMTYNNVPGSSNNFGLPGRNSAAQDYWGFYNGQTSNVNLIPKYYIRDSAGNVQATVGSANRAVDPVACTYGVIKSISYPSGGNTQFQFEANEALVTDPRLVNFQNSLTQNPQNKSFTYAFQNSMSGNAVGTSTSFTVTSLEPQSSVIFSAHVLPTGSDICGNLPGPYPGFEEYYNPCFTAYLIGTRTDGTPVNTQLSYFNMTSDLIYPGTYTIKIQWLGNAQGRAYVTASWREVPQLPVENTEILVGGLRIQSISNYDPVTNTTTIKKYQYTYNSNTSSSGTVESLPVFTTIVPVDIVAGTPYTNLTLLGTKSQSPLLTTQGSIIGYANVIETFDNNGQIGKNSYAYTSDDVTNDPMEFKDEGVIASLSYPHPEVVSNDWKRGLLKKLVSIANVNNTDKTVFTTDVLHVFSHENEVNYVKIPNIKFISQPEVRYQSGSPALSSSVNFVVYYTATGIAHVDNSTSTTYDNLTYINSVSQKNVNVFDPVTLENARTLLTNSSGKAVGKQFKYPLNYAVSTATDDAALGIRNLIASNKVKEPIETLQLVRGTDGAETITGGTIQIYFKDKPEIKQILTLSLVRPIPLASFTLSTVNSAGNFVYDSRYEGRVSVEYTANLNISQQTNNAVQVSSYLWDYKGRLAVAKVMNASQVDIAYTSFEADGTGNWTIGSALRSTTTSYTGRQSYTLSGGALSKAGLTSSNSYIVSYWTKNAAPLTIAGTVTGYPVKGATNNGWTYYEHKITGQTTVTVSGTGSIDEVRLYPWGAQMTTYTYDPLVGMTSSTDPKGETTYYEYDSFQRLSNIKDKDGNIVKHMEYHYNAQ